MFVQTKINFCCIKDYSVKVGQTFSFLAAGAVTCSWTPDVLTFSKKGFLWQG